MNPLHQLTRRPVKAAFGVLLLALAGAIPVSYTHLTLPTTLRV